jgi:hypothetical protein
MMIGIRVFCTMLQLIIFYLPRERNNEREITMFVHKKE